MRQFMHLMHQALRESRKKLLVGSMIFVLSFSTFGGGFVAAQATTDDEPLPEVCFSTPPNMTEHISFSNKVLNALFYIDVPPAQNFPKGVWQGGTYSLDARFSAESKQNNPNILQQFASGKVNDLKSKANGLATIAIMVANQVKLTAFDGIRGLLGIFSQPRPIIRDLKRLYEIDRTLGEKIDELGLAGHYFEALQPQAYQQITQVMKQHTGPSHIFDEIEISAGASYANVVALLLNMNEKHKAFLSVGGIERFGDEDQIKSMTAGKIKIKLNPLHGTRLKNDYIGARKYLCNTSFKDFKENMENLVKSFGGGIEDEIVRMKDAVLRLGAMNFKSDTKNSGKKAKEYNDRERELMKTLYGLDIKEKEEGVVGNTEVGENSASVKGGLGLAALWRGSVNKQKKDPETIKAEKKAIENLKESRKQARMENKDYLALQREKAKESRLALQAENKEKRQNDPVTLYLSPTEGNLAEDMSSLMNNVILLHEQSFALLYQAQATDLTDQVGTIVTQINVARNMIKGEQGEEDLVNYLGKACEAQCSNLGGTCWDE